MKIFRHLKQGKERGVALVFTLGILGLLTIIALGFASTSLINSKIARNASNSAAARLIAKAALERILFIIGRNYPENMANGVYSYTVSKNHPSNNNDWLWKLDTSIDGTSVYQYEAAEKKDDTTQVEWQYVDSGDEVLGRYAYEVIADRGKLDPSVHFGKWKGNKVGDAPPPDVSKTPQSLGKNEGEVSMADAISDVFTGPGEAAEVTEKLYTKRYEIGRRWADLSEIFKYLTAPETPAKADDEPGLGKNLDSVKKAKLREVVDIRKSPDPEAYWEDINGDGKVDKNEFFQRFDLNRENQPDGYKWENITVKDLTEDAEKSGEGDAKVKIACPLPFDRKTNENFKGPIPWLRYWQDAPAGTDWTSTLMKQQIAANLIQYNLPEKEDTVTESGKAPAYTAFFKSTEQPKIYGVGRHPMLNELGFRFSARITSEETSYVFFSKCTVTSFCTFSFGGELIDLFGIKKDDPDDAKNFKNAKIYLYGTLTFKYPVVSKNGGIINVTPTEFTIAPTQAEPWFLELNKEAWYPEGNYKPYVSKWLSSPIDLASKLGFAGPVTAEGFTLGDIASKLNIKDVNLHLNYAVLTYANGGASGTEEKVRDVAYFNKDFKFFETETSIANTEKRIAIALEANDPRVNNFASDWDYKNPEKLVTGGGSLTYPGSPDGVNKTISNLKNVGDQDNISDPAFTNSGRLSTAYVRHGPMQSLWELGCISRAEKWCTLNLTKKKVFAKTVTKDLRGGGIYGEGDANLLDQVKLRKENEVYGKINLNSDKEKVLKALMNYPQATGLHQTNRGLASYTDLTESKASLSEPPDIASKVIERTGVLPLRNRSDLLIQNTDDNMTKLAENGELKAKDIDSLDTKKTNLKSKIGAFRDTLNLDLNENDSKYITKAEREQLIGKFINLAKAEQTEQLYVIILAQSIKDTGKTNIFVDWNGDGTTTNSNVNMAKNDNHGWKKFGYLRKPRNETELKSNPKGVLLSVKPSAPSYEIAGDWGYQNGADKITGEAKMVVILQKIDEKWRIVRLEHGE